MKSDGFTPNHRKTAIMELMTPEIAITHNSALSSLSNGTSLFVLHLTQISASGNISPVAKEVPHLTRQKVTWKWKGKRDNRTKKIR
jgi:hypothetical protein